MKKGYPFYLFIGILIVFQLFLLGLKYPAPLYSPGDVAGKHSELRCRDCHAPFRKIPSESCSKAGCHPAGKTGKKPAVRQLHTALKGLDCLACHTDHLGPEGRITRPFDHKSVPGVEICIDCHRAPGDGIHIRGASDCRACHEIKAWKPSTYNHDDYLYLDKNHNVICSKCHDRNVYTKYNCMNCHEHASRGIIREHEKERIREFGDCLRCHSVYFNGRRYGTEKVREGMVDDDDDDHDGEHGDHDGDDD